MKNRMAICALMMVTATWATAQMAPSHAPTAAAPAAAASNPNVVVPNPTGKPVAKVNGVVLTDRDLVHEEYAIFPYAKTHGGIPTGAEADIRRGAMQMLIFEELVYQEAERRKFTVPPAKVDKAMVEFRKQFKSTAEYQAFLKQECNNSEQVLRAKVTRSLVIDAFLKQEVDAKSVVSVAEAKAYYDKNPKKFALPESYSIQSITILPPENATPAQLKEAKKHADDAYKLAKATKSYDDFGLLAEKMSEDSYRVMMGDHKAVDVNNLPPVLLQALKTMQPGQITALLEFDGLYTVVRLNSHNPAREQSFDEAKDALRKSLQQQKTEQLRSSLDKKLYSTAKVEKL